MCKRLAIILTVGLLIGLAAGPALGQMVPPPPGTPPMIQVQPAWRPISGVPGVDYVPTARQDLFRYQNNYYCWHDGRWFQGQNYGGPWNVIQSPPPAFTQIAPHYWKTPPGWAHGRKVGWRPYQMPPGQAKKQLRPAGPAAAPYASNQMMPPVQPAQAVAPAGAQGPGQGRKGGPAGLTKHQGEGWEAVPANSGGQGGPPGKGWGKFK